MSHGVTMVALPDLEALLASVGHGHTPCPLTRAGLQAAGLGHLGAAPEIVRGLDAGGVSAVLGAAIAERRHRAPPRVELVWTGPEAPASTARDTAVVRQLFRDTLS